MASRGKDLASMLHSYTYEHYYNQGDVRTSAEARTLLEAVSILRGEPAGVARDVWKDLASISTDLLNHQNRIHELERQVKNLCDLLVVHANNIKLKAI